jgi:cytochrome c oxidase subunit 2
VLCGVIASAAGIAIGLSINWFPPAAASRASKVDTLYDVLIIATVPVFVLVASVILFSAWRFRMRPGEENLDGPPIHGDTRLEIAWTVAPAVLILGLVVYALIVLHDIEARPAGPELQVNVTGQQFAWTFEYPTSVTGGKAVISDSLVLPEGESVDFAIRSRDVLHAFWVPAFRAQESAVPGITTHMRVTPTRLGTYDVVCNQLCGLGHSTMRARVRVITQAQFHSWLAHEVQANGVSTT